MIDDKVREAIDVVNKEAGVNLVRIDRCSVCGNEFINTAHLASPKPICRDPKCRGPRKPKPWTPMT